MTETQSLYSFRVPSLEGEEVDLSIYDGMVTLIVNVASECGYTPQYAGLQELHSDFEPDGFSVVAFPCNDFGGQEPGTHEEIRAFCTTRYAIGFALMGKVQVVAGDGQSEVYTLLDELAGALPEWNFGKYVVSRDGRRARFFPPDVTPDDAALRAAIEEELAV